MGIGSADAQSSVDGQGASRMMIMNDAYTRAWFRREYITLKSLARTVPFRDNPGLLQVYRAHQRDVRRPTTMIR
jgi:hypothetical protein